MRFFAKAADDGFAMLLARPVSSMTLPKIAPKRKIGKNDLMYVTAFPMNSSVYDGIMARPDKVAAKTAMTGAMRMTEKPR